MNKTSVSPSALPRCSRSQRWQNQFDHLLTLKDQPGWPNISRRHKTLGIWLNNQRMRHKAGKLETERIQHLSQLPGFLWTPHETAWNTQFATLLSLKDEPGWPNLLLSHPSGMGRWLKDQRVDRRRGELNSTRIKKLTDLPGFYWNVHEQDWDDNVTALVSYKSDPRWPNLSQAHPSGLGKWLNTQRQARKNGTLSLGRQLALSSLPGFLWVVGRSRKVSKAG